MFEVWFLQAPIISKWTNDRDTYYKTQLSDSNSVTLTIPKARKALALTLQNS